MRAWRAKNPGKWTEYVVRYQRKYPERHAARIRAYRLRNRTRLRMKYLTTRSYIDSLKAIGCTDCDNKNFVVLDFDHVGPKTRMVSTMVGWTWDKIEQEVANCEVRCANCHRMVTAERQLKHDRTVYD